MIRDQKSLYIFLQSILLFLHPVNGDEHDCLNPGEVFFGHRHFTVKGETCLFWKDLWKQGTTGFPDATLEAAENNCRDPDKRGAPWCFVSTDLRWQFCDIPKCNIRESVFMTPDECGIGRLRAGYKNGDIIPIYSDKADQLTRTISYPGCSLRFEACKACKFHVTVSGQMPTCNRQPVNNKCVEGCQMLAVKDGLYPNTTVALHQGTVVDNESFHSVSNVLIVDYCQRRNTQTQLGAKYTVTAFVINKHIHLTALSGEILSPNFPNGYYSEKETYIYSVDPPMRNLDTNLTLIFYDWDLNGSAGSTILIKWQEKLPNQTMVAQERNYKATDFRPTLFIPASSFQLEFVTGSMNVDFLQGEIGFSAKFDHVNEPSWAARPHTQCGRYLSRSGSIGGFLTYSRITSPDINKYFDCIWVIPMPRGYTRLRYNMQTFEADPSVSVFVRDGVTTKARLIPNNHGTVNGKGLLVHITGHTDTKNVNFNFTYLAMATAYAGECRTVGRILMFYCQSLGACIDQDLYPTHATAVCGIAKNTGPLNITCPEYMCKNKKQCFTEVEKCNIFKDCDDGSDEDLTLCYKDDPQPGVNVALAVILPIVAVLFLIPIVVISVCIVRQRKDELKDEELRASRDNLVGSGGGTRSGLDNPGLQLEDIPVSADGRHAPPRRLAPTKAEMGAPLLKTPNQKFQAISADIHGGKSPYSPRGPGETQSMRLEPNAPTPSGSQRPTRSYRFELPPDIDSIEELPEEPKSRHPRAKQGHTTLANYRPDDNYDRTPEGRSYREPPKEPERLPGDGSYRPTTPPTDSFKGEELPIVKPVQGARPKTYQPRYQKSLAQYKPEYDLPKRYDQKRPQPQATQSYRVEAERQDVPMRGTRSYRYQPEMEVADSTTV